MTHFIATRIGTTSAGGTIQYQNTGYVKRVVYDEKGNVREVEYLGPEILCVTGWPSCHNPYLTPTVPTPAWPSLPWTVTC